MKKFSELFFAVCVFMVFSSCGGDGKTEKNDNESKVDDEISDVDEEAVDVDSDAGIPKTKPGDDFFSDALNVQYTFKGYINEYEVVNTEDEQKGSMELSLKVGDLELTLNDIPTSYIYTYPDTAPENFKGKTVVAVISAGGVSQTNGLQTYFVFINVFNADKLKEMKNNNIREFNAADAEAGSNLNKYYVKTRADSSRVYRKCLIAMAPLEDKSRYFINNSSNKDFKAGESMLAWGNVEMTSELNIEVTKNLTEYEGELCSFSLNGAPLTKDEYEAEMIKDMTKFDCEMSEEFLTPGSEKYAMIKIKGKLNAPSTDTTITGKSEMNLDGTTVVLEDVLQTTAGVDESGNGLITLDGAGGIETISGQTHYKYKYFQTIIRKSLLQTEKDAGKESILIDDILTNDNVGSVVYDVEEKQLTAKTLQKICLIAMPDKSPAVSKIFMCFKNNTVFADGEEIQGAANISLNDDSSYLMELMNATSEEELCYCTSYTTTSYTPAENCDEFENTNP